MMDRIKKLAVGLGIAILIWAVIDPGGAADFVHFLWFKIEDGLVSLVSFVKGVFNQ
jgi:hypothetical protein